MADIARYFRFDCQPPMVRLIFSFCIVIITGTLFFWLLIFAGSVIFGIEPGKIVQIPPEGQDGSISYILKYVQFSRQAGLFLLPSLLISRLMGEKVSTFLRTNEWPNLFGVILVVILAFVIIPLINFTGALNSKLVLPDSMSGIQHWIKTREDNASHLTSLLIATPGMFAFIVNIFILAVLPSLCEEFLFRGVLQRLLSDLFRSSHAGVWMTAVIFSSIHFQFFGFIPRMMLGLLFGYLFFWSGNLWYPIAAHFANNFIPVTVAYISGWKSPGGPAVQIREDLFFLPGATIITAFLLYYFWSEFRKRSTPSGDLPAGSGEASS